MTSLNHHAASLLLKRGGYRVSDVAAEIGEDRSNLTNVLAGRRTLRPAQIGPLAHAIGVPVAAILGPDDPKQAFVDLAREMGVTAADLEGSAA